MRILNVTILLALCLLICFGSGTAANTPAKGKAQKSVVTDTAKAAVKPSTSSTTTVPAIGGDNSGVPVDIMQRLGLQLQQTSNGPRAGEQINWDVIASGGGPMSSANFILDGTLGQPVAGESSSPNFALNAGYWQNFAAASYTCGDVDGNNQIDITDAVFLVNYIFASGAPPDPLERGDVDCNNQVDITDAVYIVNYIFASGAVPCAACP